MYDGFLLSSVDGRIFYANQAVESISGVSLKQIIGKTPIEMKQDGTILEISTRVKINTPITMIHKLKTGNEVFITSKPIYDENGNVICFAANYRNLETLQHLNKRHENKKNKTLNNAESETENWIGESYNTQQLKEKVTKIAKTEAIVLIMGESGVGKEIVANNIHQLSERRDKPYIQINCAAIPEELMEAELFGYEKGAFTGADSSKEGLFEAANGGTVLLDEIGEMPLHMQVKLLRVIQTKKITRVGDTKEKSLNIRIVAATNKNLEESVKDGEFREDLFYRLNVIPITVPPLKERREDIIPLSEYFLNRYNETYEVKRVLAAEVMLLFQEYSWPGNIRELENTIERLVIMTDSNLISGNYLPSEFKAKDYFALKEINPVKEIKTLTETKQEAEKNMIELAIQKYDSIRQASQALGVHHSTVLRKIEKYKIKRESGA